MFDFWRRKRPEGGDPPPHPDTRMLAQLAAYLLETLERHAQLVQANTVAVTGHLRELQSRSYAAAAGVTPETYTALHVQLEQANAIIERLQELRRALLAMPGPAEGTRRASLSPDSGGEPPIPSAPAPVIAFPAADRAQAIARQRAYEAAVAELEGGHGPHDQESR